MNQIQKIYNAINNSGKFVHIIGHNGCLYKTKGGYIGVRHYGKSAIPNSISNLKWVLETIFETDPETAQFILSDYLYKY